MATIGTLKLLETYVFTSNKPSRVKYEIYTDGSALTAELTIYRINPIGVQSRDVIVLIASPNHPEFARDEAREHFRQNYA
ncbi:hypothetical protein [Serratia sp. P2ACOL2]|uniref:hypothetical protein n=1 Tax=Serratia sp. P2ACOL2 TaxID=2482769 RepID=UPI000EFD0F46|nr:hypothetical protein [Serratia sp. P2ACOL2]AYO37428.1 hypothetical protein EBA31_09050 [Serratia sp. P2ACOL2]